MANLSSNSKSKMENGKWKMENGKWKNWKNREVADARKLGEATIDFGGSSFVPDRPVSTKNQFEPIGPIWIPTNPAVLKNRIGEERSAACDGFSIGKDAGEHSSPTP